MSEFVLDASALLALLNNEKGASLVEGYLKHSIISSVNFSEIVSQLIKIGMPESEVYETLNLLGLEVIAFNLDQAFRTGLLINATKSLGLSFGDRACLSLALGTNRIAVTADRVWKSLDIGIQIEVIR